MLSEDEIVEIGAQALFGTLVTNVTFEESHGRDELRKQSRAYLAALRAAGLVLEQGWQPIETAPRDPDHSILVWHSLHSTAYSVRRVPESVYGPVWATPDGHVLADKHLICWRPVSPPPLPAPPTDRKGAA